MSDTHSTPNKVQRKSNIELLRIISMMMVLIVHLDGATLGLPELSGNLSSLNPRFTWILIVEAFVIIGVNCFTLISGYFGIRLRFKNVAGFIFECLFYSVGIYTAITLLTPAPFSWKGWVESWLIFTHTDLWYVPAYFMLMLLSPFINEGFKLLSNRKALIVTVVFTLYNLWAGWWWDAKFNPTGYTVMQLIMMYMIGRCIFIYQGSVLLPKNKILYTSLYITASLLTALYSVWVPLKAFAYNSPFVVVASLSFFMIFVCLEFKSSFINYAAKSAFAVYLVHKAPLIWGGIIKRFSLQVWNSTSIWEYSFYVVISCLVIYGIVMGIDFIRRKINPFK